MKKASVTIRLDDWKKKRLEDVANLNHVYISELLGGWIDLMLLRSNPILRQDLANKFIEVIMLAESFEDSKEKVLFLKRLDELQCLLLK